jgi:hypothetical protein
VLAVVLDERLRLALWVAFVLSLWGLAFGVAIFGVPVVYYGWLQYQCWRAGPDSEECWWFDLLKHPSKPREKLPGMIR